MKKPLVELLDISKTYHTLAEETIAIEGFSMAIYEGDFIAIVGPSGCGKSTVLSILAGLCLPSGGVCQFDPSRSVKIGYMLQHDCLLPWRTILKNALLGLEIEGRVSKENAEYVRSLLNKYGLGEFVNSYPYQLSGGMRQRAALIRTLAVQPDLLLLDEPFSALDYQTRLRVSDDIGSILRAEGKTAVLVTHDISEAISLADRIFVMSARPSTIKAVYDIELSVDSPSALLRRGAAEFDDYYNIISEELDYDEG